MNRADLTSLDADFLHLEREFHPRHFAIVLEFQPSANPMTIREVRNRVQQRAGSFPQFQTCSERGIWRRPLIKPAVDWDGGDNVSYQDCEGR
jgi:hypothetical protein